METILHSYMAILGSSQLWVTLGLTSFLYFPRLQTQRGYLALGVVAALVITGRFFPAFLLLHFLIFFLGRTLSQRSRSDGLLSWATMSVLMAFTILYAWGREYSKLDPRVVEILFQMHLFLRLFCFLWDCGNGTISSVRALNFFSWSFFPLTFFGPIIRYYDFEEKFASLKNENFSARIACVPWSLFFLGALQLFLHSSFTFVVSAWMTETATLGQKISCWFFFVPWSIFLGYAGLWHLFEALSHAWKIPIPINFNRPLLQTNLGNFWSRWNVCVTSIFRDYLFFTRWGFRKFPLALSSVITFVAVGLWHSTSWFGWGLMHGVGFAVFLQYHSWRVKTLGATKHFPLWYRVACFIMTYSYVCVTYAFGGKIINMVGDLFRYISIMFT